MYKHKKYTKSIKKKASSSDALSNRLNVNKKYSKKDLSVWLFKKYKLKKNYYILEVGAGRGQHVFKESKIVGINGQILAIDNSQKSINIINKKKLTNVKTKCVEMDYLPSFLKSKNIKFDRILSSYAIYYANNPILLIKRLINFLKSKGQLIITVPNRPHTLIDLVRKKSKIPINVEQSLVFGKNILKPYLKRNSYNYKDYNFHNELKIKKFDDLLNMYKSSTFFVNKKKVEDYLFKNYLLSTKKNKFIKLKKSALTFIIKKFK